MVLILYISEITNFKNIAFESFWKNASIKELITSSSMNVDEFRKHVFPYLKHPSTVTEEGAYIFFDVDPKRSRYGSTLEYTLYFDVLAHDSINIIEGKGTRVDMLEEEIEREFLDSRKFGIGKLQYGGAPVFSTPSGYYGRRLTYYTTEFRGDF